MKPERDEAIKAILELRRNDETLIRDQQKIIEVQNEKIEFLIKSLSMTVSMLKHLNQDPAVDERLNKLIELINQLNQEVQ